MTKDKKKTNNREYYLKNKTRILAKHKKPRRAPSGSKVIQLFQSDTSKTVQIRHSNAHSKPLVLYFLFPLILGMTLFLIHESAAFYLSVDESTSGSYFKALLLEGATIAFTCIRGRSWAQQWMYKLMIIVIYSYGLWAVSNTAIHKAVEQQKTVSLQQTIVHEVEGQIQQTKSMSDRYLLLDRITLARKSELKLDELKLKLELSRLKLGSYSEPMVIWNTLFALVCFRVLVMLSNVLLVQYVSRTSTFNLNATAG